MRVLLAILLGAAGLILGKMVGLVVNPEFANAYAVKFACCTAPFAICFERLEIVCANEAMNLLQDGGEK